MTGKIHMLQWDIDEFNIRNHTHNILKDHL